MLTRAFSSAVQLLARDPLPLLLSTLAQSKSADVRSKALYAISGLLKHSEPAAARLQELDGWITLRTCLGGKIGVCFVACCARTEPSTDSSLPVRRKAAFLFNSLLLPSAPASDPTSPHVLTLTSTASLTRAALVKFGILEAILDGITVDDPDEDLADKSIRVLLMFLQAGGALEGSIKDRVQALVQKRFPTTGESEVWGLTGGEWEELRQSVQASV